MSSPVENIRAAALVADDEFTIRIRGPEVARSLLSSAGPVCLPPALFSAWLGEGGLEAGEVRAWLTGIALLGAASRLGASDFATRIELPARDVACLFGLSFRKLRMRVRERPDTFGRFIPDARSLSEERVLLTFSLTVPRHPAERAGASLGVSRLVAFPSSDVNESAAARIDWSDLARTLGTWPIFKDQVLTPLLEAAGVREPARRLSEAALERDLGRLFQSLGWKRALDVAYRTEAHLQKTRTPVGYLRRALEEEAGVAGVRVGASPKATGSPPPRSPASPRRSPEATGCSPKATGSAAVVLRDARLAIVRSWLGDLEGERAVARARDAREFAEAALAHAGPGSDEISELLGQIIARADDLLAAE